MNIYIDKRKLIDKQLMLQDVKSWVGVNSYEQYFIRNILEWIEEFPTVELCDDAISRLDAIEAVTDYILFNVYGGMKSVEKCEAEAKSILCDIPTVEQKRNNGEWIIHENADIVDGYYVPKYECQYCHTINDDDYNFCTECGSDMRKLVAKKEIDKTDNK